MQLWRAMLRAMVRKSLLLGLALALAVSAAAAAHDYIVVTSSDPAIARGQAFDSGARIPLASGRSLTLMYASGDLVTLKGVAGGVVAPARRANSAEAQRLEVLRLMVGPAPDAQGAPRLGRTRGGICPPPEALVTLDDIASAANAGCHEVGRLAFEAWIAARLTP